MRAVIIKEFQQLRRDHRTVAMLVLVPLLLLLIFGFAASFDVQRLKVGLYGANATRVAGALPADHFDVVVVDPAGGYDQAYALLQAADATVAVVTGGAQPQVYIDGADLFAARAAVAVLGRIPALPEPIILFNPDLSTSTVMVPAIIGMILVFVGTIATSLGVVRERQSGTMEMLAVMPLRPRDVFVGKVAPYLTIAVIDLIAVVILGMVVFGVPFNGSVLTFALGAGLFLFVASGLGVLISTVSQNQGQAIQLAIMTLLPQVLLSGMIFPLDAIPLGVRWISYLLPLTYFVEISRGVMVRGAPIGDLLLPLAVLALMAVVVFGLSVLRFRRELEPARGAQPSVSVRPEGAAS